MEEIKTNTARAAQDFVYNIVIMSDNTSPTADSIVTFSPDTKEETMEEGIPTTSTSSNRQLRHAGSSRLSLVSKQYDIRGEGHLDETEQKMRAMDREGRGYVPNEQVYQILQDQSRMQASLKAAKRLLILFAVLLVILAVANIGIAFAAAKLAKDTTIQNDVLVVKGTDTSVATNSHADLYNIETSQTVSGNGTTIVVTTMTRADAEEMRSSCIGGGSVNLVRSWPYYRFNDVISVCPADSYPSNNNNKYTFAYTSGNNIEVDCSTSDDTCIVSGKGLLQEVDQDCVFNEDCATNNCLVESWIPEGDPGRCACLDSVGCANDETCVDNVCQGPNGANDNIVI